jgi:hypothetical protein
LFLSGGRHHAVNWQRHVLRQGACPAVTYANAHARFTTPQKGRIFAQNSRISFKVPYFLAAGVGWRGTCKPIAHDENGYRCRKSAERDECLSRCFFKGVHH